MELKQKINAFVLLGDFLRQFSHEDDAKPEDYNIPADRQNRHDHLNLLFKEDFENAIISSFHYEPQCAAVCPVDCCVDDPNYRESKEELLNKKNSLHL